MDISIPLDFHGEQPAAFGVEKAIAKTYISGNFIGDTRRGGGCNFEKYSFVPHCNGTHTECVGHISNERIYINDTLRNSFIPSVLISVNPILAIDSNEKYLPSKNRDDFFITKDSISYALKKIENDFLEGLIIRTLPNDVSKKSRDYLQISPPYFSLDAIEFINFLKVKHLLVDIPSVDRTFDEGKLSSHHIFWEVPLGSHDINVNDHSLKTITEMIFVPSSVSDGLFILNLQLPSFRSDASPSRPIIYEVMSID